MSKLQVILAILQAALLGLSTINDPLGAGAKTAGAFISIIQHAMNAYQAESGQPLDLTKLPMEAPIP